MLFSFDFMLNGETTGKDLWMSLFCNFLDCGLQVIKCKTSVSKRKSFPTLVIHINMFFKKALILTIPIIPDCITVKIISSKAKHR